MIHHLTYTEALVVGLFQGVTELFPVSSLGHSVLIPALVGGSWAQDLSVTAPNSPYLAFIVGLHVATAIAMIIYFWRDWIRIIGGFLTSIRDRRIETVDQRLAWMIILGTIPVGIVGALLQHTVQKTFAKPVVTAVFLTVNGVILFGGERLRRRQVAAAEGVADDPDYGDYDAYESQGYGGPEYADQQYQGRQNPGQPYPGQPYGGPGYDETRVDIPTYRAPGPDETRIDNPRWDDPRGGRPPRPQPPRPQPQQPYMDDGWYEDQGPWNQPQRTAQPAGARPSAPAQGQRALKQQEADEGVEADRRLVKLGYGRAIFLGSLQILALLPGISRDGIVMIGGMFRGLPRQDAARFSFLLSAPVIFAAGALKLPDLMGPDGAGIRGQVLAGSIISGIGAFLALRFLVRYLSDHSRTLTPFAIYCLVVGLGSAIYLA
ncbi:MAG: undecaprenyl-diphosphate phosphatase [Actinobacteria bacterium]|nr:undecaprenyl-diphosphate phosphatase [Actinomycetota bacterium]